MPYTGDGALGPKFCVYSSSNGGYVQHTGTGSCVSATSTGLNVTFRVRGMYLFDNKLGSAVTSEDSARK